MPPNVGSDLFGTRRVAASKGPSQIAMIEHAQPRYSMNSKTSKKSSLRLCFQNLRMHHILDLLYQNAKLHFLCIPWTAQK